MSKIHQPHRSSMPVLGWNVALLASQPDCDFAHAACLTSPIAELLASSALKAIKLPSGVCATAARPEEGYWDLLDFRLIAGSKFPYTRGYFTPTLRIDWNDGYNFVHPCYTTSLETNGLLFWMPSVFEPQSPFGSRYVSDLNGSIVWSADKQ